MIDIEIKIKKKQEAFSERRHLHVFDLWHWGATLTLSQDLIVYVIRCRLLYCTLVPGMMSVSGIVFEIWPLVHLHLRYEWLFGENLNDVTMTSSLIWFLWNLTTNRPRVYLSDIPNFILIGQKRAEIESREVNRALWRKNGYYVTVTLTFDPISPNSIGFEPVC